jgi:hypothetical protein
MPSLHITILLEDHLSESWSVCFDGLQITSTDNHGACLSGDLIDHSALHGLLERIRDLNLHLVSLQVQPSTLKGNQ